MSIAEQLEGALLSEGVTNADDLARTFFSLAKNNRGLWKSEKQARFLLKSVKMPMHRSARADQWASSKGIEGNTVVVTRSLAQYGRKNTSKIRFVSNIFVVDEGGVAYIGKVKVNHARKDNDGRSLDWDSVTDHFVRTATPTIKVDVDAEIRKAIERNQPQIDMIKTIPDWSEKDILVDFVRGLEEGGRPLTLKQMSVVQKYLPTNLFIGDKEKWKKTWDRFLKVFVDFAIGYLDEMIKWEKGREKEYEKKRAAYAKKNGVSTKEAEEGLNRMVWWSQSVPDVKELRVAKLQIVKMVRSGKFTSELQSGNRWFVRDVLNKMTETVRVRPPSSVAIAAEFADELNLQVRKAIKAKKPSKKALGCIQWITAIVEKHEGSARSNGRKAF